MLVFLRDHAARICRAYTHASTWA